MSNVIDINDHKRKAGERIVKEKLYTLDVYAAEDDRGQVYKYSLNGGGLVIMTPELVLDSLAHLVPDVIGFCTDPSIVLQCEEAMLAKIYDIRKGRKKDDK